MKKKARILFVLSGLVILIFILMGINSFKGNPISKHLAKHQAISYLEETYPKQVFKVEDGIYNFKFSSYEFHVTSEDDIQFQLSARPSGVGYDSYRYDYVQDKLLSERFENQLEKDVENLLLPKFDQIYETHTYLYIAKDQYPSDKTLDPTIISEASISFGLLGGEIDQMEFITLCDQIRNTILDEGIEPKHLRFDYNLRMPSGKGNVGPLQFTLELEENQVHLPAADFAKEAKLHAFNESGKDPAMLFGYRITSILRPLILLGVFGTFIISGIFAFNNKAKKKTKTTEV